MATRSRRSLQYGDSNSLFLHPRGNNLFNHVHSMFSSSVDPTNELWFRIVFNEEMRNYSEGQGEGGSLNNWWDEINNSEEWQEGIFYALCAIYSVVSLVALKNSNMCATLLIPVSLGTFLFAAVIIIFLSPTSLVPDTLSMEYNIAGNCSSLNFYPVIIFVQLIRIQLRVPEFGWTTQKVFHFMNFVVNGLRAILFGLYKDVFVLNPKVLEIVLLDLPGLLFFSTYTLLVLFWAEIYHQARSLPINKLRPAYLIVNGVVYFIQVCIWISITLSGNLVAVEVAKFYFSVISFVAALGFLIYGGRLFFMLRRFPIESRGRQKKLNEVGFVTGICCTGFLIRCFVVALSAINDGADLDVLNHPILSFIYYMIAEIIPSSLVLFILRKLPPRRVSNQYHPIK